MDKSKKTSEKYNRGSTNGEPDYTRDLPTWRKKDLKKTMMVNNIGVTRNTQAQVHYTSRQIWKPRICLNSIMKSPIPNSRLQNG